jgi:hypothetical protein
MGTNCRVTGRRARLIDHTFPLSEIVEARRYLESLECLSKVLVPRSNITSEAVAGFTLRIGSSSPTLMAGK